MLKRREFLVGAGALGVILPSVGLASVLEYEPGLVAERLAAGETLFIDFKADWCTTCRAQERTIEALKAENPAYGEAMTFVAVDWDQYGRSDLVRSLGIPRRSTLIVLKGDQELGRIVADTRQSAIKDLLDIGLAAATA